MKKSLSILLCTVMIVMTFCSCKIIKSKEVREANSASTTTSTTSAANKANEKSESNKAPSDEERITVYVTDKDGEYVTKKDGSKVTEIFDVEALESQLAGELEKHETSSSKNSGTKTDDKTSGLLGDTQSSKEDLLPEGTKANNTTLMKTQIEPILKGGTYTIKGNIKTSGQQLNATVAFRNNAKDFSVSVSMSGFSVKAFSTDGKYYLALPMFAKYAEVSSEDMGDMSEMTDSFKAKDAKFIMTTTVKNGKNTYTCEEYKTDTSTVKYYFNEKKEWKRMEIIEDEDILVWEITSFTNKADDSLFAAKGMIKDNKLFEGMM